MREIKFKYYFPIGEDGEYETIIRTLEEIEQEGYETVTNPEARCQWTGLKDKAGKEIYEGDNIKVTDEHGNEDSGPVWYLPERASYCIVWHEGESSFSLADCKDQIEILGNIFEGDAEEGI